MSDWYWYGIVAFLLVALIIAWRRERAGQWLTLMALVAFADETERRR